MLLLTPATIIHSLPKIPDTEYGGATSSVSSLISIANPGVAGGKRSWRPSLGTADASLFRGGLAERIFHL